MSGRLIVALDGHDGVGKTTLSQALARRIKGTAVRPFSGETGANLLRAGKMRQLPELIQIGQKAIENAIASAPADLPVVLDRGWMTVASFVPNSTEFMKQWSLWVPTTLCWVSLETTLIRLGQRDDEEPESLEWHTHYLAVYETLAQRSKSPVIRTDLQDEATCVEQLTNWANLQVGKVDALDRPKH